MKTQSYYDPNFNASNDGYAHYMQNPVVTYIGVFLMILAVLYSLWIAATLLSRSKYFK